MLQLAAYSEVVSAARLLGRAKQAIAILTKYHFNSINIMSDIGRRGSRSRLPVKRYSFLASTFLYTTKVTNIFFSNSIFL